MKPFNLVNILLVAMVSNPPCIEADEPQSNLKPASLYEYREIHDRDGIGKFYQGREISHVMGHLGASWLERPERDEEEKPTILMKSLKLSAGDVVADIGAGSGYMTRRLAKAVGPSGRILAVDIQPEMIELLKADLKTRGITNVEPILGTITNPNLPEQSVDLAIMVDVYHEFSFPHEMMAAIKTGLKPGGRIVFVEYRAEDPSVPIKRLHKMTEAQAKKEAAFQGFEWVETIRTLPRQHIIIFKRPN